VSTIARTSAFWLCHAAHGALLARIRVEERAYEILPGLALDADDRELVLQEPAFDAELPDVLTYGASSDHVDAANTGQYIEALQEKSCRKKWARDAEADEHRSSHATASRSRTPPLNKNTPWRRRVVR
jgi:hypothetical protein